MSGVPTIEQSVVGLTIHLQAKFTKQHEEDIISWAKERRPDNETYEQAIIRLVLTCLFMDMIAGDYTTQSLG